MSDTTSTIVIAVTADISLVLLRGFPEYLVDRGWRVHVVSSPGPHLAALAESAQITTHSLPMVRDPAPLADVAALVRWISLLRRVRPTVTYLGTPKASLLGTIAAWITRVPCRVHLLRGLRLETTKGFHRTLLLAAERLTARLSSETIAVSSSLARLAVEMGAVPQSKIRVLGPGSSNGVDVKRFESASRRYTSFDAERQKRGEVATLGYVGRLAPNKGLPLLAAALKSLAANGCSGRLLLVGAADGQSAHTVHELFEATGWSVEYVGRVSNVEDYYPAMDLLVLPTDREGFPTVVLEAAAAGVPTVATSATGIEDAVVDNVTGVVVRERSPAALSDAIGALLRDRPTMQRMGTAARQRVRAHFSSEDVWERYATHLESVATGSGGPVGSRRHVKP